MSASQADRDRNLVYGPFAPGEPIPLPSPEQVEAKRQADPDHAAELEASGSGWALAAEACRKRAEDPDLGLRMQEHAADVAMQTPPAAADRRERRKGVDQLDAEAEQADDEGRAARAERKRAEADAERERLNRDLAHAREYATANQHPEHFRAMRAAADWYQPPVVGRIGTSHRGRSRAPKRGAGRRRGSRRGTASRADPSDGDGEPPPPGHYGHSSYVLAHIPLQWPRRRP